VNTTPQGRHGRLRKPALAALSVAATVGAPALVPASAEAAQKIKVKATSHVLVGHKVRVKGRLSGSAGARVRVERSKGGGWTTVDTAKSGPEGRFRASFRGSDVGGMKVRVVAAGAVSRARRTIVYRRVSASYYGPGLYGNKLACGGRLRRGTLGVAHKTLPCGTRVRLKYRRRTIAVRVIDRGPYAGGRTYDLTEATRDRLHFPSTGRVWSSR
jgi:rare lipoprotein A